ncbi:lipase family protein [Arthrobacter sp. CJ23]|uniref:lipase family protein n=1 Tax=Arthrobacter sp. CJ23 TaxID=2972479 RepID=UPI00215CE4FA|nr:lipase family protein [Arthrobacter sp. CJ23]UVJ40064.1 lipase family protein [Arthrobacter sp. CJ23]
MKHPSVLVCSALALAAVLTLGGGAAANAAPVPSLAPATAAADPFGFYTTPASLPAGNGDLVRSEPSVFYVDPLKTIRAQASVQRIMYRSVNSAGTPIAVTGTVLVPYAAWTGSGPRPLVAYAAGTQGQGDQCAPSRAMAAGEEYEGLFIAGLLARGYSVAVTDYEGLGTAGSHTYMARASQAHAVLDAARAAQRLGNPQIVPGGPVALAGYSQGGGASAAAVELAPEYAPELNLKGAYAGAVPADLPAVGRNLDGGLYTGFLLYAVTGMSATGGLDLSPYLNAAGQAKLAATDTECTVQSIASSGFLNTSQLTVSGQKLSSLLDLPEVKPVIAEQKIGNGRAPAVPVLLSHSLLDDVIPFDQGRQLAKRWCAAGSSVYFDVTAGATHVGGYAAAIPQAFIFLERRFSGQGAISNCWLYG